MVFEPANRRLNHPCFVCTKRKVKCDKLVPCTNCVKRGEEKQCMELSKSKKYQTCSGIELDPRVVKLIQDYEYWIFKLGIMKNEKRDCNSVSQFEADIEEFKYWIQYLDMESSFKLLDYSMEKLGGLYFGCTGDIGELYFKLEEYWNRREVKDYKETIEECLWNGVLWSVLTLAVYYIPVRELKHILPPEPVYTWCHSDSSSSWSEELQSVLYESFLKVALFQLKRANFMQHPDIKVIQAYLILANTSFPQEAVFYSNGFLNHCIHVCKLLQIDNFKSNVSDSAAVRLAKLLAQKIWYKLSICDYLQTGPNKQLCIHTENDSLIKHAAYYEDLPNIDVYQSEDTFETLAWKLFSLDRDLEQYNMKKPTLKSLETIKRQLDIFTVKINALDDTDSFHSKFETFLSRLVLNLTYWKTCKLWYMYYGSMTCYEQMNTHAKIIIVLVLNNMKGEMLPFNKYPHVLYALGIMSAYYNIRRIIDESEECNQLAADLLELLDAIPKGSKNSRKNAIIQVLRRLQKLEALWKKVRVIDNGDPFFHPVFKILGNDINILQWEFNRISFTLGGGPFEDVAKVVDITNEAPKLRAVVKEFEDRYNILECIYPLSENP
ncbi:HCL103Cp [Eremothecium sinecaudum]|uniref:HCL103Cp n=1 Tax=Eremothecium sinecaudum TaxID=45286 RepID=A0A0X8HRF0_9SACH|nr:HCL103Cp [Eremothecium sinecaudum]AMD20048.1 HCL103Cp [Eremothecium sinecaudum]